MIKIESVFISSSAKNESISQMKKRSFIDTIKRLRELEGAATPGPWLTEPFTTTFNSMPEADALLIVEMRNNLKDLLDRVEVSNELGKESRPGT